MKSFFKVSVIALAFVMVTNQAFAGSIESARAQDQKIQQADQEILDLQKQLDSAKSARTWGTAIGMTAASASFLYAVVDGFSEAFASGGMLIIGTVFGDKNAAADAVIRPKFDMGEVALYGSGALAAGSGVWFVFKTTEISTIKAKLKTAHEAAQKLHEGLSQSLN